MLRDRKYVQRQILIAVDLLLAVVAFFAAHWLRKTIVEPWIAPESVAHVPSWLSYGWLLATIPPLTVIALNLNGYYSYYDADRFQSRGRISRATFLAVVEAAGAAFLLSVLFRDEGRVSRAQTFLIPVVLYALLELKTVLVQSYLLRRREAGKDSRLLLLVGSGAPLAGFIDLLGSHPYWGFHLGGIISDSPDLAVGRSVGGVEVIGALENAMAVIRSRRVDSVVLASSHASLRDLEPVMRGCEEMGIRTHLMLNVFDHVIARPTIDMIQRVPVVTYSPVREMGAALLFKYLFDRVAAAVLLAAASLPMLVIALAIRLTSKRGDPIFFGQARCGLNGKPFTFWKFRTMRVGAERELDLLEKMNEADGPVFKMKNDPRVTPVGRVLRRTSLDELPQLYNVLKGDMSLVGPRPPIPSEVRKYDPWQLRRLSMRPGITCLWQVSGRSHLPFETWMKLDLEYIDNWSLWLDFKILLRTIHVVLTGYGAM
ncbi:MAG: sugar transferase [Candidatus Sumerlaeota bacterium]|nr:sugar transferase [Candidatus Sumerlaeota bacterium]